ncbi:MAG: hypothetical protein HKN72_08430 [Gemmatimonadetes bacterium]|nr:hypothetical protein [Gemmatimonadota bacterium]
MIASLLFVGLQLRQANALARLQQQQAFADAWQNVNLTLATEPLLLSLLAKIHDGGVHEDFPPEDAVSIDMAYRGLMHGWEQYYLQLQLGVLDEDAISFPRADSPMWNSDYLRGRWPTVRAEFQEEFAEFWESRYELR